MSIIQQYLEEAINPTSVQFIVHKHHPRNGSLHYDLRFIDPKDPKLLHSFAFGSDFEKKASTKIVGVKTRDHDPRWLTLKSYRLETIEEGKVTLMVSTKKYFEMVFDGKILNGLYKLIKVKSHRGDNWILVRKSS